MKNKDCAPPRARFSAFSGCFLWQCLFDADQAVVVAWQHLVWLAPSGGGSRPAAGTPLALSVEALVLWHCAVAARTPPQACLQRRQWRCLSAMFSREHMTIQTGVLNVFKCFVFFETRTSVQRPAPFSNVFCFVRADQRPVLYAFAMAGSCESRPFCLSYFNCGRQ